MLSRFFSTVAAIAFIGASQAAPTFQSTNAAIYTLDNNPSGASIIAVKVCQNGTLSSPTMTSTGGKGLAGITGPGQPGVGALFGSDAIVVEDGYIFTVNPGSNTVSMFWIEPSDPLNPVLVGSPADTLGDFPMSVTYSSPLSTVCVLNGGARGGVTCFSVDQKTGLTTIDKAPRSISSALNQTTPPVGPFSTASDIKFNPSSSALFASVKGSPLTKPVSIGSLFVWPVTDGVVSTEAIVTENPRLILDFSITFGSSDFDLLLTDPAIGADFLSVSSNLTVDVDKPINITYQKATCWSTYDPVAKVVYTTDAAETNITVISVVDGSISGTINFDPLTRGGLDSAIGGSNLFVLTQSGMIVSVDVSRVAAGIGMAKPIMTFNPLPNASGSATSLNGLGVWIG